MKSLFRINSIKKKIILIIMATCIIALLLTVVAFNLIELTASRSHLTETIATHAEILGLNSSAALIFHDPKAAESILSVLSAEPDVASATLYTREGRQFAQYLKPVPKASPSQPRPGSHSPDQMDSHLTLNEPVKYIFHKDYLELYKAIVFDGEIIGFLHLNVELSELNQHMKWFISITGGVILLILIIAYLISFRLQNVISKPILYLMDAMRNVSKSKDYAIQVKKQSEDELGALMDGFNEMLGQIQKRDQELERHKARLEAEVERRTAELLQSNRELEAVIDELKKTYQVLAENQRRLAYAQDIARLGYWEWLKERNVLLWSGEALASWGFKAEEIGSPPGRFLKFVHPGDRKLIQDTLKTALTQGKSFGIDLRVVLGNEAERIVHLQGEVIWGPEADLVKMTGTIQDITERKQAEAALRESEQKYRVLMDEASEGIILLDVQGKILEANKKMEELLGLEKKNLIEMYFVQMVAVADREKTNDYFEEVIKEGSGFLDDIWLLRSDGKKIPVEINASVVEYGGARVLQGIVKDISERLRIQEERLVISKMESIGVLAGGIAHDFNNILTAILGNISLAKLHANFDEESLGRLANAERACERAQGLALQLLSFAKGGTPVKKPASVAGLLRDSANFTLSGSRCKCEFALPKKLWVVEVDEGQITQVINNLLINADQAMPEGGIIKIQAENFLIQEKTDLPLPRGKYVKITITDQGIGIPPQYLHKIFDPYFSTKAKNTGLGLATVYSIIKNHHGHISVESEMGVGTTFHIYLRAREAKLAAPQEEPAMPMRGSGKILIMDDENLVREVIGRMIHAAGFEPVHARDGFEAVDLYKQAYESNHPFVAVILDLTIRGGIGGKETIKLLQSIDPRIKAIVSSGYSDDPVMANYKEFGFSGVIAKPYKIEGLIKTLHEVIGNRG